MPTIQINGKECEFDQGKTILQVASANGVEIPSYCYHDGLSIVASCRICLVEVWAPNPRNDNKLEPIPKLLPACQTPAGDGQVVYSDSPKAIANQKAVMEYLLINHPLDCPVCDQAGECGLQDYSYNYGRGVSRFEETKIKQPKKDVGPNILLYSDRCIMCTRCVRFTREVSGDAELMVNGRGAKEQIDVFPGKALDNPLASNVIDLCPVGALLDKDFLFRKRVWDLTSTPSIDGITSSGDNLWIEHADDKICRIRPRDNMDVNKWWITDEVRYGWKFVHSEDRIDAPTRRQFGAPVKTEFNRAYDDAIDGMRKAVADGKHVGLLVSPMLACEEAYLLAQAVRAIDPNAIFGVGPIPTFGEDQVYPPGVADDDPKRFVIRAEKCPNSRGVRRVLEGVADAQTVWSFEDFAAKLRSGQVGCAVITGGYPSDWVTDALKNAMSSDDLFVVLMDLLSSPLCDAADVVLPSASWAEKSGTFENANGRLQGFMQAIPCIEPSRAEGQMALDLFAKIEEDEIPLIYDAMWIRQEMASVNPATLGVFASDVHMPPAPERIESDMQTVEL